MKCRENCGACCIAPSITSAIPGMKHGKKASVPCIHLTQDFRCRIFDSPDRPKVCGALRPNAEMCGNSRDQALCYLEILEKETSPKGSCP